MSFTVFVIEPQTAVRVTVWVVLTEKCFTLKVAVLAPPETLTDDATLTTDGFELDKETVSPAEAAGPLNVTVPVTVVEELPTTELGETITSVSSGASIFKVAVFEMLPSLAVIVAETGVATAVVLTLKVAVVLPLATVTLEGALPEEELDERETLNPAVGAGPVKVTVPVEDVPPTTEVGETETLERVAASISRLADLETPPALATIEVVTLLATALVSIENFAVF